MTRWRLRRAPMLTSLLAVSALAGVLALFAYQAAMRDERIPRADAPPTR